MSLTCTVTSDPLGSPQKNNHLVPRRHFAISILHEGQREIAEKLGRPSSATSQKLKGIKTKPAPASGVPVLADALGWVECRVVATLPGGDHTLVLGEVVEAGIERDGAKPLTLEQAGFTYSG